MLWVLNLKVMTIGQSMLILRYESSYDPWADMVAAEETEEDDFDDDFEDYEEDQISIREIPRCPCTWWVSNMPFESELVITA